MSDLAKPIISSLVEIAKREKFSLGLAISLTVLAWLYADIVLNSPLNKYEVIGLFVIILFLGIIVERIGRFLISIVFSIIFSAVLLQDKSIASDFWATEVPELGDVTINLPDGGMYIFNFDISEMRLKTDIPTNLSELDCIKYERVGAAGLLEVNFCGYADFSRGGRDVILSFNGHIVSGLNVVDFEVGGGGGYGHTPILPSAALEDCFSTKSIEINIVTRAFLPSNHEIFKRFYVGYGMYAFLLFRDRGNIDFESKVLITDAFISTFPDDLTNIFSPETFGLDISNVGVFIYPTDVEDVYLDSALHFGFGDGVDEGIENIPQDLVRRYNYNYASYALKEIRKQKNIKIPKYSLVLVPESAQFDQNKFYLSNFDWSQSLVIQLDGISDYQEFFTELNNYFIFDLHKVPTDIFSVAREFVGSIGRLGFVILE